MAKLIVVIGMPGSGKTEYLKVLKEQEEAEVIIDDYQKDAHNKSHSPAMSKHYGHLLAALQ